VRQFHPDESNNGWVIGGEPCVAYDAQQLAHQAQIHEGLSNFCLNARFATEPFRAVEVLDDLLPLTGAPQSD